MALSRLAIRNVDALILHFLAQFAHFLAQPRLTIRNLHTLILHLLAQLAHFLAQFTHVLAQLAHVLALFLHRRQEWFERSPNRFLDLRLGGERFELSFNLVDERVGELGGMLFRHIAACERSGEARSADGHATIAFVLARSLAQTEAHARIRRGRR